MKKLFLLGLFCLTGIMYNVVAAPVDQATTRRIATYYWNAHRPVDMKAVSPSDLIMVPADGYSAFRIYAVDDSGFVIVAADDRLVPIIGYSFDSPASRDINPETAFWLNGFQDRLDNMPANAPAHWRWNQLLAAADNPQLLEDAPVGLQLVEPLLSTRWDQGDPFNLKCPFDSVRNERAVVGCVATAMAQIMKRWNYPSCGTGSHSYVPLSDDDYGTGNYGTQYADFEHTTYLWQMMPNLAIAGIPTNQSDALSTLSYHCGVAVDMIYGPSSTGGSGAYSVCGDWASHCAMSAFPTYFKYSPDLFHLDRNTLVPRDSLALDTITNQYVTVHYRADSTLIPDSVWFAHIDSNLALGQPIYYTGRDYTGGHAFVLDGSDLDTNYHFNWGWGGSYNGYYAMDNLAPHHGGAGGNSTYTFNISQGAIFGIRPLEERFDTIDRYDTVCASESQFVYYEYTLPAATMDTLLRHLDTIFRLHLKMVNQNILVFEPNGGNGNRFERIYCRNKYFEVPNCNFSKPNCEFVGWCLISSGNGTIYQPQQQIRISGNKSFYAIWQDTTVVIGVDEVQDGEGLNLWPNPTTGDVYITVPVETGTVIVTDVVGRTVLREDYPNVVGGKAKIAMQTLPEGIYTIQVRTARGVYKQRVIKK
ncbi:MAG: thiol protease/hemagglutinin PrtT [Bacteroidales bacterium]|nr:thiol protease/hemagglutinin PrtT [Bacteroidales bacterium]